MVNIFVENVDNFSAKSSVFQKTDFCYPYPGDFRSRDSAAEFESLLPWMTRKARFESLLSRIILEGQFDSRLLRSFGAIWNSEEQINRKVARTQVEFRI